VPRDAPPLALSVILPTLDEVDNLRALVPELLRDVPRLAELLVVDDGSEDGTQELVRKLAAYDGRVRLLAREGPPCLTRALRDGFAAARSPLVGWMDADGAMSGVDLERLAGCLEARGLDLVVGTRFAPEGRMKGQTRDGLGGRVAALTQLGDTQDPWYGVLLSWTLNAVVLPAILRDGVHDYTSGFAVARRELLGALPLRGDHGEYFIDLWTRAERAGFRIGEEPYRIRPRRHGHSKTASDARGYLRRGRRYLEAAWRARRGL
jgi:dolichol-phosphate mannosyltransferase